jgi:hypothetical protein
MRDYFINTAPGLHYEKAHAICIEAAHKRVFETIQQKIEAFGWDSVFLGKKNQRKSETKHAHRSIRALYDNAPPDTYVSL